MRLFHNIPTDNNFETIAAATAAIMRKAQALSLTARLWSLVELQPDKDDMQWLDDWVRCLQSGVTERCLKDGFYRKFTCDDLEFSYAAGIGTLLLLSAVEKARRDANEGVLWRTIRQTPFSKTTRNVLFGQEHPTQAHKDAIEQAARWLGLRHVFGIEGLQSWLDTLFLQFGFTRQGFTRRLPEWLTGQGQTLAIQQLLNVDSPMQSATFQDLWRNLLDLRRKNITEDHLRVLLNNNPWMLPEWADDLVRQACAKLELSYIGEGESKRTTETLIEPFLDAPKLRWDPPDTPEFICHVSNLAHLDLSDREYDIIIAGYSCGRLQQKADGSYKAIPSNEIKLPVIAPLLVANLVASGGEVIQSLTLQLWDEGNDVSAFNTASGNRFDPWEKMMRPETAYVLLLAPDLTIEPRPTHWHKMERAHFYLLMKDWPPETQVLLDENRLWQPYLSAASPTLAHTTAYDIQVQLHNPPQTLHFGYHIRFCIKHSEDINIVFMRIGSEPVQFKRQHATQIITKPITVQPHLFSQNEYARIELTFGVKKQISVTCVRYFVDMHISGTAILTQHGWSALNSVTTIPVEQARTQPVKFFLMERDKWILFEGDVSIGKLWDKPRPLPTLMGWGAALTLRNSVFNAIEEPHQIVEAVINHGNIVQVDFDDIDVPMRILSVRLTHPVEPDVLHRLVWWDMNGSLHLLEDIVQDEQGMVWLVDIPPACTSPIAIAIAYNGCRSGTWWCDDWYTILSYTHVHHPRITAALLRWFHLPLLGERFSHTVQRFVLNYANEVLPTWIGDSGLPPDLQWTEDDGWLSVVHTLFWQWQPHATNIDAVVRHIANASQEEASSELKILQSATWKILRVSPLLMGNIVKQWVEVMCLSQWGVTQTRALIHNLIYTVADVYRDDALQKKKETLSDEIATTLNVDPNFVEKELIQCALRLFQGQRVESHQQNNISIAIAALEPFRRLLGIRVLEFLHRKMASEGIGYVSA